MTDQQIPDHRDSYWWGILFPRPTSNCPKLSQLISVLMVPVVLTFGVCVALLQVVTLPILIVVLLASQWSKGIHSTSPDRVVTG